MSVAAANKFGFTINRTRLMNYDTSDRKVREYVTLKEPSFKLCFGCGGCTATCTAGQHTSFNLRRMNNYIRRGEIAPLREEVTRCMLSVSYTHLRAHETRHDLVCRLLLE